MIDLNTNYPIPAHLTWNIQDSTKIKCFMECPRKYFFEYTLGWRLDRPNIHLIFGSAWHEALAYLYINGFDKANIKEAFYNHFLPYYRTYIDPDDDEIYTPKTPARAYLALAYYSTMREKFMQDYEIVYHEDKPMVEIGGTVNLTEDHTISFKMDTIIKNRHGISALEHKTGSNTWNWSLQWYLSMQIGTYNHVLNCLYPPEDVRGVIIDGTFFKKTKDNPKTDAKDPFRHFDFMEIPIYHNDSIMNQWLNNAIMWLDMIDFNLSSLVEESDSKPIMQAFPMNTTGCANWFGCQYHDFCRAWANPLQHSEEPPIGFKIDFWNPLEEPIKVSLEI